MKYFILPLLLVGCSSSEPKITYTPPVKPSNCVEKCSPKQWSGYWYGGPHGWSCVCSEDDRGE